MTTERAFLADIIENPDDDAPRLVFADWLEDQGRPERAEFIRVQCELASLPEGSRRYARLHKRQEELEREHGEGWLASLGKGFRTPQFRRGFVEVAQMTAGQFLRHAGRLTRLTPLRRLRVTGTKGELERLLASPHLARLEALDLTYNKLRDAGAAALANCPFLAGLSTLVLGQNGIGDAGMQALADSPHLAGLTLLSLCINRIGEAGIAALADSPHLGRLEALDVGFNQVGDTGAAALGGSTLLSALRRLAVCGNGIGVTGVRSLLQPARKTGLTALDLSANDIGDEEALAVADSAGLSSISSLCLAEGWVGDAGVQALARSEHAGRLGRLDLSSNRVSDAGAQALASSHCLPRLRLLNLDDNLVGACGARALHGSGCLAKLRQLNLGFNLIPPEVVRELDTRPTGNRATCIDLFGNDGDGTPTGQQAPRPVRGGLSSAAFAHREMRRHRRGNPIPCRMTAPEGWTWPWYRPVG